jgi:hypothetical protein
LKHEGRKEAERWLEGFRVLRVSIFTELFLRGLVSFVFQAFAPGFRPAGIEPVA